ncbi:MAG: hypothetical protein AAF585_08430, partial [Verrucomicrobiota bacterium]
MKYSPLYWLLLLALFLYLQPAEVYAEEGDIAERLREAAAQREGRSKGFLRIRDRISERLRERSAGQDKPDIPRRSESTGQSPAEFREGANCLFIGHSFFVPIGESFDKIGARSGFESHEANMVFSPGPGGSPGQLWENEQLRGRIENTLAGGDVDLLGMPSSNSLTGSYQDYQRWIELALRHNPETQFFIGQI